ncbi:hypothetical protein [Nocardia vermiculata]|uniref:Uncharacterized protein n=1 Tax=Nocardia vermiculata TaxID=257274 RepID=A0A846XWV5_9NOCA|nr:hypothetical protein [Nocardia vermiculata]NKY50175.1 hypothetical protein [Nocardia vermiculata]
MSAAERVSAEAARGAVALDHMLTCRDIGRVFASRALAGDPEAATIIRQAAQHMRRLKGV